LQKCGFCDRKLFRLGVHIGEVAAATAGHQDLFAGLVGVVDQHHLAPTPGGGQRAHQACGASANDHNVGRAQSGVLTKYYLNANQKCGSGLARDTAVSTPVIWMNWYTAFASKPAPTLDLHCSKIIYRTRTRIRTAFDLAFAQALGRLLGDGAVHRHISLEVKDRDLADLGARDTRRRRSARRECHLDEPCLYDLHRCTSVLMAGSSGAPP
jgi:hypothetical protein